MLRANFFGLVLVCFSLLSAAQQIGSTYTWSTFDRHYEPWKEFSVSYELKDQNNSAIFRANQAERFGLLGRQFEIDWYPKNKDSYWYVNAGFSGTDLYPDSRYGLEYFQKLPEAWEASLGARALNFRTQNTSFYTASAGKYWGDWWLNLRNYTGPGESGTSSSWELVLRRYLEDADNYYSLYAGQGFSYDTEILGETYYISHHKRLGFDLQKKFGSWLVKLTRVSESLEYVRDEYVNRIATTLSGVYIF